MKWAYHDVAVRLEIKYVNEGCRDAQRIGLRERTVTESIDTWS